MDNFVRYDWLMSGAIDRAEWRAFLTELLDETPKRKKAPLARTLGIAERTLDRWLDPDWDGTVSEASVRQVAERSGRSVAGLFQRLGYLEQPELPYPPEDAWIVEVIMAAKGIDAETKAKLIAVQLAQAARERDEHRRRIEEQLDMMQPQAQTRKSGHRKPSPAEINS